MDDGSVKNHGSNFAVDSLYNIHRSTLSLTYQSMKEGHFVKLKSKVNDYWVIGHGPTV